MTAFIAVFRPHQRRAWAQVFDSEQSFTDAWANGHFDRSCHCNGDNLTEEEREMTFDNAVADAKHDLHTLTFLDSAEEAESYLTDRNYAGHHNKAVGEVRRCAEELGWIKSEEDK